MYGSLVTIALESYRQTSLPIGFHSSFVTPLSVITFHLFFSLLLKKETIKRLKTEFNTRFYIAIIVE
jgi:hypothetical protein